MRFILMYITVLLTAFAATAQNRADTVKVYFRVGYSRLDPSFAENRKALTDFDARLSDAASSGTVDSLVIRGYASPEGYSDANQRLSALRTKSVAEYITAHTGLDSDLIHTYPGGVAWNELRSLVDDDPNVPYRKEIIDILDNVPVWVYGAGGKIIDGRKKRLMNLGGGEPWRWMLRNLFPELRNAVAVAVYFTPAPEAETPVVQEEPPVPVTEIYEEVCDSTLIEVPVDIPEYQDVPEPSDLNDVPIPATRKGSSFLMAVKTNMLYDAALVPNLGVEFALPHRFSVYGDWMYAWWDSNPRHRYWRVYGGEIGARWWFGRKAKSAPLSGHHVGVYGGILTFDFELGDNGYMGGKPGGTLWDRYLVNAGIEYGFSLPVTTRLNIDFSIGLGYLGGNYIKYYPFDNDYYYDKEYKMRFFGPTKAEISLVWLIGPGYSKYGKGGGR